MEEKIRWFRIIFSTTVFILLGIFFIYLGYDIIWQPKLLFMEQMHLEQYQYDTPYYVGYVVKKGGFLEPTIEKVRFYNGTRLLTSQDVSLYLYKNTETPPILTSDSGDFNRQLISAESEKIPSTPFQLIFLTHVTPANEKALGSLTMRVTFSYFGFIKKDQCFPISLIK